MAAMKRHMAQSFKRTLTHHVAKSRYNYTYCNVRNKKESSNLVYHSQYNRKIRMRIEKKPQSRWNSSN